MQLRPWDLRGGRRMREAVFISTLSGGLAISGPSLALKFRLPGSRIKILLTNIPHIVLRMCWLQRLKPAHFLRTGIGFAPFSLFS